MAQATKATKRAGRGGAVGRGKRDGQERLGYVLCLLARVVTRVRDALPALDYETAAKIVIDGADRAVKTHREVEECVGDSVRARGGAWCVEVRRAPVGKGAPRGRRRQRVK